jgi:hypothetical protein
MDYVPHTQHAAYEDHVNSGKASTQARRVFIVIKYGAYHPTNREIAKALRMEPGTVSARRKELMQENKITEAGVRRCTISKRMVKTWRACW